MRFGIMTLQRTALFPDATRAPQAVAHLAAFRHVDLAARLHCHGFNPIEISGDLSLFLPHTLAPQAIRELQELKASTDVTYTVHLPLWSVEPSTPLAPVRQGSVRAMLDAVQATMPLEPEVYVLHATGALAAEFYRMDLPDPVRALLLSQFRDQARSSIATILTQSGLAGRQIAVETIEFPLQLTLEIAEDLDLSVCLDVGHILSGFSGPIDLLGALDMCLPRLAEIHLHDAPACGSQDEIIYGRDHRPLGDGDLDVARLFDRLSEAGYAGPVIFELTLEQALDSLDTIRSIRPEVLP